MSEIWFKKKRKKRAKMKESNNDCWWFAGCFGAVGDDTALHGRHARAQVPHDRPRQHVGHVAGVGHARTQFHPHQGLSGRPDHEHGSRKFIFTHNSIQ